MKMLKKIVLSLIILALLYGIYYASQAFPIISGYGAKNLCSCVFVAGRQPEDVINNELGSASPLLKMGTYTVDYVDSSATGKVFGMASKKAVYRKGLGCTLVSEISESTLRGQKFLLAQRPKMNQDTVLWPMGNRMADSLPSGVNLDRMNRSIAKAFEENNLKKPKNTRAVVVLYKGQMVAEKYADGFDADTRLIAWSMTKSITNALVGILVKQGQLDIYHPAPVPNWANDDRSKITLDQLLRASSGLDWEENYGGPADATNMLYKTADMGAFAAQVPIKMKPDSVFYYSSGTTNIISWITRNTLQDSYHAFPYNELFYKLGMYSAVMEPDASGTFVGSSYMYATARDYARFGLLYYNNGLWQGERILPEGWVEYTATPSKTAPIGEYGAQWWLNAGAADNAENKELPDVPNDCFYADGFEGQRIFIIPSKDLVVVRLGLTRSGNFDHNEFLRDLIASLE